MSASQAGAAAAAAPRARHGGPGFGLSPPQGSGRRAAAPAAAAAETEAPARLSSPLSLSRGGQAAPRGWRVRRPRMGILFTRIWRLSNHQGWGARAERVRVGERSPVAGWVGGWGSPGILPECGRRGLARSLRWVCAVACGPGLVDPTPSLGNGSRLAALCLRRTFLRNPFRKYTHCSDFCWEWKVSCPTFDAPWVAQPGSRFRPFYLRRLGLHSTKYSGSSGMKVYRLWPQTHPWATEDCRMRKTREISLDLAGTFRFMSLPRASTSFLLPTPWEDSSASWVVMFLSPFARFVSVFGYEALRSFSLLVFLVSYLSGGFYEWI